MKIRQWARAFLVALTLLQLEGLSAWAIERVTLGLSTLVAIDHSDLLFGSELGFFRDEGLELSLIGFQGSSLVIPQVINKSVQFGLNAAAPLIYGIDKGRPLPIRFVYNWNRSTLADFAVLADSPIKSLTDLKGKKLGIYDFATPIIPMTQAALKELGVEWQKDVEVRPVGLGPAAWKQLETGRVDALNLNASEDIKMVAAGLKIRRIPYPDKLRTIFGVSLFTHNDTIRDRPDLVSRMGRAMAKSTIACTIVREVCVKSFWRFDPTSRPPADKEADWIRNAAAVLEATHVSRNYFSDHEIRWGSFPSDVLDSYLEALKDTGLVSRTDLPREAIYTNQFVASFNEFDPKEVRRRASEYAAYQVTLPQ